MYVDPPRNREAAGRSPDGGGLPHRMTFAARPLHQPALVSLRVSVRKRWKNPPRRPSFPP